LTLGVTPLFPGTFVDGLPAIEMFGTHSDFIALDLDEGGTKKLACMLLNFIRYSSM
jgi:hypothetical protein